jgi:putative transposase
MGLLDETSREVLRRMIWKVAEFCGVEVITYAILPNHFHVLLRIPERCEVSDEELLRRYRLLHPKPSPYLPARPEVIAGWLEHNTEEGRQWRARQMALMHDLSAYMKLLKQRFTIWYNAHHQRFGTLWAERFKSILVEYDRKTLQTIAAYIDLNAVRKGLVEDPKDYRFCGYAEAVAGEAAAQRGLRIVCPTGSWRQVRAGYRELLYSTGGGNRAHGKPLAPEAVQAVMDAGGRLPLATVLRCRWRHLSSGAVLGKAGYVDKVRQRITPPKRTSAAHPRRNRSAPATPWGGWCTLYATRRRPGER